MREAHLLASEDGMAHNRVARGGANFSFHTWLPPGTSEVSARQVGNEAPDNPL